MKKRLVFAHLTATKADQSRVQFDDSQKGCSACGSGPYMMHKPDCPAALASLAKTKEWVRKIEETPAKPIRPRGPGTPKAAEAAHDSPQRRKEVQPKKRPKNI